jgi:hypothetical protein
MFVDFESGSNKAGDLRNVVRNDFLFAAGAIAVIAGLLFPLPTHIFDTLLIFSISLTAAILIITLPAQGLSEIPGFPLLIVMVTILRLALSAACSRLIFSQNNPGIIINTFGGIFVKSHYVFANLVFGTLAIIIFGITCKTARGISRSATEFISSILPVRQIGIDCDLNAGIIDDKAVLNLREKIARENNFFTGMGSAAKFMRYDAAIETVIVIINIVGGMAMGVMSPVNSDVSVRTYATMSVGAGMLAQIPALLIAAGCGYLVRKNSRWPVVNNRNIGRKPICLSENKVNIRKKVVARDVQWLDETTENKDDDLKLWVWEKVRSSNNYKAIAKLIENKSTNTTNKVILIAAEKIEELPVTIPVNIAMRLAQDNKNCLLIDLDLERNAISKVFDVYSNNMSSEAIAASIKGLWIWPGPWFTGNNKNNIKKIIAPLKDRYDYLIIYAPSIKLLADYEGIAGCINSVMLFGAEGKSGNSTMDDFHKLLAGYGCEFLKPAETSN